MAYRLSLAIREDLGFVFRACEASAQGGESLTFEAVFEGVGAGRATYYLHREPASAVGVLVAWEEGRAQLALFHREDAGAPPYTVLRGIRAILALIVTDMAGRGASEVIALVDLGHPKRKQLLHHYRRLMGLAPKSVVVGAPVEILHLASRGELPRPERKKAVGAETVETVEAVETDEHAEGPVEPPADITERTEEDGGSS